MTSALVVLHGPVMWLCMAISALVGLLGLVSPAMLRSAGKLFTGPRTVRIAGIVLLLVGAEMFLRSNAISLALLVKTLSVVLFMSGGVFVVMPTAAVVLAERSLEAKDLTIRVFAVIAIVLTWLFYLCTKVPGI